MLLFLSNTLRSITVFAAASSLNIVLVESVLHPGDESVVLGSQDAISAKSSEQWQRARCQNRDRVCFDMPQPACCDMAQGEPQDKCTECDSNQLTAHFKLEPGVCNKHAAVNEKEDGEANQKVVYAGDLAWWPPSHAAPRKGNIITIDGVRWFKISPDVPEEHTAMLEAWWTKEDASYDELPDELLQYEVAYPT